MAEDIYAQYAVKTFHGLASLLSVVFTIVLLATAFSADKNHTQFFMTNSFLSTYESDSPLVSYSPLSKPFTYDSVYETYLNCLMESRVGINDMYNCTDQNTSSYRVCLAGLDSKAFKVTKMTREITALLSSYGPNVTQIVRLPSSITGTAEAMRAALESNHQRNVIKLHLSMQSTKAAIEILEIIVDAERAGGIEGCQENAKSLMFNPGSPVYDVAPVFTYLWQCTSEFLVTEPIQKVAFEKCIPFDVWPSKDVMQTPYSLTLFGSYNPYFLAIIAGWLMSSFTVYTFPGATSGTTANGKPDHFMARGGKFYVLFGFIWNCAGILIIFVRGFTPSDRWENFPMSIQTVMLTFFFTVTAIIYFGREIYELFMLSGDKSARAYQTLPSNSAPTSNQPPPPSAYGDFVYNSAPTGTQSRYYPSRKGNGLAAFMRVEGASSGHLTDAQYTPLIVPVWVDTWIFVDVMFFLAFVGLSKDVVSADLVVAVTSIFFASLVNSAMIRLTYEGYINEVPESQATLHSQYAPRSAARSRDQTTIQSIRVMAMIGTITGLLFSGMAFWLVAKRYGSDTPMLYVLFSSLLPQVFWLVLVIILDWSSSIKASLFFDINSICFAIQVIVRFAFMVKMFADMNLKYNMTVGDSDSLNVLLNFVNVPK